MTRLAHAYAEFSELVRQWLATLRARPASRPAPAAGPAPAAEPTRPADVGAPPAMRASSAPPKTQQGAQPWLVGSARTAGAAGAESLVLPEHSTVAEAWDLTCKNCQLEPEELAAHVAQAFGLEVADL